MLTFASNLEPAHRAHPGAIDYPPPPTPHPFRLRKVLGLLRDIDDDPEKTDVALTVFDAVGGEGGERTFQRFIRSSEGRRLYRRGDELVDHMADREALAAMPEGSLGRAYLDFAMRNGFTADSLVGMNRDLERETSADDPVRQWFWDRYTAMHDLWHVVTGCDTTPDGECLLLAFTQGQSPQRGYRVLLTLIVLRANINLRFQWSLVRSWLRGRQAGSLVNADWEALLPLPLEHVRRRFGVPVLS